MDGRTLTNRGREPRLARKGDDVNARIRSFGYFTEARIGPGQVARCWPRSDRCRPGRRASRYRLARLRGHN